MAASAAASASAHLAGAGSGHAALPGPVGGPRQLLEYAALWEGHLATTFWGVCGWIQTVVSVWPNFAVVGFCTTFGCAILSLPLFLILGLSMVWCTAAMGPVRKTLSTVLVLILGVPAYIALSGLICVGVWVALAFLVTTVAGVLPFALFIGAWMGACTMASAYIEEQRRQPAVAEDITFGQFFVGLGVGLVSLATFGVATLALTLLKSPFVFLACAAYGIMHSCNMVSYSGWWCLPALICCLLSIAGGLCALACGILVSALLKFTAAGVWPAYVATGWLRHVGGGGRRNSGHCCTPLVQGCKAGYQVLWAADVLTNAVMLLRLDLLQQTQREFMEIATGQREQLSEECRLVSCLPPVTVNLFQGSWDMTERTIAGYLGVPVVDVSEAWESLKNQMVHIGEQELAAGRLTEEYVSGVPPELVIGLPARVLFHTVERSPGPDIVFASGLRVSYSQRPTGPFAERVWRELKAAKAALANLPPEPADCRDLLAASLLAGGGDPSELPDALAQAVERFQQLPPEVLEACMAVHRPLIGIAVECSRQCIFRAQLEKVLRALL